MDRPRHEGMKVESIAASLTSTKHCGDETLSKKYVIDSPPLSVNLWGIPQFTALLLHWPETPNSLHPLINCALS